MKKQSLYQAHWRTRKNNVFKLISLHRRNINFKHLMLVKLEPEQYPGNA